MVNEKLQKVLKDERDIKTRLAAEVQYLYQEIHKMQIDRSKLIASTSEKVGWFIGLGIKI